MGCFNSVKACRITDFALQKELQKELQKNTAKKNYKGHSENRSIDCAYAGSGSLSFFRRENHTIKPPINTNNRGHQSYR